MFVYVVGVQIPPTSSPDAGGGSGEQKDGALLVDVTSGKYFVCVCAGVVLVLEQYW